MTTRRPGVFCLEGEWSPRLTDRSSVAPTLDLLNRVQGIRYVHRDVSTVSEFENLMSRWPQRQYERYLLGYLSFHGSPGGFHIGRHFYTLEQLSELVSGQLRGKILYFGSCATLDVKEAQLRDFLGRTGARAICGYELDVDWMESAAFDLLLIDSIAYYDRVDAPFRWLDSNHHDFCERLGFRYWWKR